MTSDQFPTFEPNPNDGRRPSLDALAALGAEELTSELFRALPGGESGQIGVAAFNSSI